MIGLLLAAAVVAAPPPDELTAARVAWRYFERNTDAQTGLVSSVDGYPSATTWDLGSSLLAAISARELGIVSARELEGRVEALLGTLARQPLYAGALPNKAYDTATARMTDYRNQPAASGIGFSAIDLGRLLSALVLLGELYPEHRPSVERVLARWDTCRVVRGGELHGAHAIGSGAPADAQEGRLGYEQYAAKAFALLGHDVSAARRYDRFAAEVSILGVGVPRDRRSRERYGALDAVVTEPWVLDALEFGLDREAVPLAQRVFEVQKRRWESTGIVTALSEDHVDRAPWFVYDSIWADGTAWRTVTPDGADVAGLRGVSTKAALALAALYPGDPYAKVLRQTVSGAFDPERGWYAGVYEDGGGVNRALSANTNGVVLEAALFARLGPLHQAALRRPGAVKWRAQLARLGPEGRTCLAPIRDASLATLAPAPPRPRGAPSRSSRRARAGDGGRSRRGSWWPTTAAPTGPGTGGSRPCPRVRAGSCGWAATGPRSRPVAAPGSSGASATTTGTTGRCPSPCTTGDRSAPRTASDRARPSSTWATRSRVSARAGSAGPSSRP